LRVIQSIRSAGGKDLRHPIAIEIFRGRDVDGRPHRTNDRQHVIALDKPSGLFHRLRGTERIVQRQERYLPAVYAPSFIDHVEIDRLKLRNVAEIRGRPAKRHGLANANFGVGGPWSVLLLRIGRK
jgi:hypothetical protein